MCTSTTATAQTKSESESLNRQTKPRGGREGEDDSHNHRGKQVNEDHRQEQGRGEAAPAMMPRQGPCYHRVTQRRSRINTSWMPMTMAMMEKARAAPSGQLGETPRN